MGDRFVSRAARLAVMSLMLSGMLAATTKAQPQPIPAAPSSTAADEEQARAHFRLGRAYYDNGDFAQAAVEFESAYRISNRSALLYNLYLAYRDANDLRHAANALRKYLELEKNVENRGQLTARLAALDRSLAEPAAAPTPTPAPAVASPATAQPVGTPVRPAPVAEPETESDSAMEAPAPLAATSSTRAEPGRRSQLVPIVLASVGGALVVGSVITGSLTLSKKRDLEQAVSDCKLAGNCDALSRGRVAELEATRSSGKTLALATDLMLFGGLAVAGTGVVLFLLNLAADGAAESRTPTASLACTSVSCAGYLRGQF
jgi:tetratricopeptide (TPR) repeat protein